MATRRTSSRKAKDAASDFVRRVMSGKWEDHRDVSPPSYKSKKTGSQSPSRAASAPVSPARSNHGNRAASPASSSPRAKVASPKKPQSTKSTKSGSLLKKALSLPTKPAAEQAPAMPELSKEAPLDDAKEAPLDDAKEAPQLVLNEDSEQRNKDTESPPKLELIKEVSKSEDDGKDSKMEKLDDGNSPQLSGDEEVPTIEDESVNTTIAAPEPEEGPPLEDASQDSKRGRGRPRKRICVEKPIIDDSRSTRPRGRPRKYTVEERPPTAVKKKGTKSFIPAYRTFVKDPTEIKEEIIDDGYEDQSVDTEKKKGQKSLVVSLERLEDTMTGTSHSVGNAKDLDRQISRCSSRDSLVSMTTDESEQQVKKKGKKKKKQLDKVNDGEEMPYVCEIKEEPLKEEPSVPNGDATTTENTSNDFEFSTIEDSAITYPAPSAQRQYFNLFGLIKKSDIKDDSLRNKLHREAGGKLRRILKPKMAPEMVYKRLTLAKGCVIQGLNPEIPRPGSSSQKITAKPKILQAEPIKPKPKETKKGGIKLSMMELELAERLLKVGDIQSVRHLLLEGKLPTPKDSPKKKEWLKPPPKKKIVIPKDEDKKPEDIVVKLSTSTIVKTRPKVPLTKKTSFGSVSSDKDDDAPGTRRSTRQRGGQRKQWWHLLRAAPDEFEEDKQWDEEQDRLDKKRRTLQEKKSHKMLLGQLVAAEEVGGEEEEEELPSSQGSSVSTASNATATAIAAKKKPKKRSLLLEPKQETSDVSLYSELYDEPDTSTCKKNSKKKDWLLAKRVLEEAKKHNGEVSIESILLDLRKKELQEAASGNKDDGPPVKKKKKKKKSVEASKDENAVRNHVNIVNQIKPLLKNFMDDTNRGTTATTLEMELEAAGNLDMVTSVKSVEVDGVTNTEFFPRVTITDNDLCKVPHMCYICWINDHMYTLNTKRTARDLPPFGGCLHYNPCEHYLKRCTDKITVKPDQQPTPDDPVSAESILRPVTEKDLFCSEKMPESDDSAPVSPGAPEGTELLSVQLKARAAQIAQSLDGATESEKPPEVVIDKDESPKDPPEEVSVTQHGAEIVIHAGRAHPPNYEELAEADRSRQMWLQSLTQSLSTSDSEKTNKVKIKLEGEEEEKLNDAEEVCKKFAGSSKHKLVRVKVQRVGNNKILLKQTREGRNKQRVEVLVREIELPVSAEGNTDYLDTEWLSGILAEEAIKLASAEEEIKQKQRTLKKLVVEKPQEKKPKTPPPEEEEVAWTMETIVSEGEEEVEEEEEKVSDIDEPEDSATTGNINVGGNGNAPDQPITIKKQAVKVPESLREGSIINEDGSEMLSVTTKDIREERPQLMNYIKDSGLARAIYQKLEVERQSLSKITEESDYVKSLVGDDLEQKLCLRAALNSERTMKQDELRTKRDDANYTGRATSDLARRCSMLEKKRIDLEDEIESCMSVLEIVQMEGMLDGHPEEVDRINRINSKMQEALRPEVQAVSVAPSPTPEALEVQPPPTTEAAKPPNTMIAETKGFKKTITLSPMKGSQSVTSKLGLPKSKSFPTSDKKQTFYLQPMSSAGVAMSSSGYALSSTQTVETSSGQKMLVLHPVNSSTISKVSQQQTKTTQAVALKLEGNINVPSSTVNIQATPKGRPKKPRSLLSYTMAVTTQASRPENRVIQSTSGGKSVPGIRVPYLTSKGIVLPNQQQVYSLGGPATTLVSSVNRAVPASLNTSAPAQQIQLETLPQQIGTPVMANVGILPGVPAAQNIVLSSTLPGMATPISIITMAGQPTTTMTSGVVGLGGASQALVSSLISSAKAPAAGKPLQVGSNVQPVVINPNQILSPATAVASGYLRLPLAGKPTQAKPPTVITRRPRARHVPGSVRVQTATGQTCGLPKLSKSVLDAIGPNDQVVVLSAEELKQLQKGPLKSIQLQIPSGSNTVTTTVSSMNTATATVSALSPAIAARPSLMPIAPKPQAPQAMKKKILDPNKARKRRKKDSSSPEFVIQAKQPRVQARVQSPAACAKSDVPTVVQDMVIDPYSILPQQVDNMGPMEAFEVLVQQPDSDQNIGVVQQDLVQQTVASENVTITEDFTDLVQLAMADCQLPVGNVESVSVTSTQDINNSRSSAVKQLDLTEVPQVLASEQQQVIEVVTSSVDSLENPEITYVIESSDCSQVTPDQGVPIETTAAVSLLTGQPSQMAVIEQPALTIGDQENTIILEQPAIINQENTVQLISDQTEIPGVLVEDQNVFNPNEVVMEHVAQENITTEMPQFTYVDENGVPLPDQSGLSFLDQSGTTITDEAGNTYEILHSGEVVADQNVVAHDNMATNVDVKQEPVSLQVIEAPPVILDDNYSAIVAEDSCVDFDQFMDENRTKEVYSQEVRTQDGINPGEVVILEDTNVLNYELI